MPASRYFASSSSVVGSMWLCRADKRREGQRRAETGREGHALEIEDDGSQGTCPLIESENETFGHAVDS